MRIYISRDVIFDEIVFLFQSLHPNARALLKSEILLLPQILLNPSHTGARVLDHDHMINSSNNPAEFAFSELSVLGNQEEQDESIDQLCVEDPGSNPEVDLRQPVTVDTSDHARITSPAASRSESRGAGPSAAGGASPGATKEVKGSITARSGASSGSVDVPGIPAPELVASRVERPQTLVAKQHQETKGVTLWLCELWFVCFR